MIDIRRARYTDAAGIAAVHVQTWRSTYASLLPDDYLADLSESRLTYRYQRMIRLGAALFVAVDYARPEAPEVLGFASAGRSRHPELAEGEIDTLYVLDDWHDQGLGKRLLCAAAEHLAALNCRSLLVWVVRDNPARYFYARMGGRFTAAGSVPVAGEDIAQDAFIWNPLASLLETRA